MASVKEIFISPENFKKMAVVDLWEGLKSPSLWWSFSVHDVKQRFRRSVLGPFWLTISLGIMIGTLGFINSRLFNQDIMKALPTIAIGIIFWNLFACILTEGANTFVEAQRYIRNVPTPISVHFYRTVSRNFIIWGHNMIIYFFIFIFLEENSFFNYLLFFPGFTLFLLNCCWLGLSIGIISTRFRDIPQIVINLLQVLFFITPVFWTVSSFKVRPVFVTWNPLHHLLDIVRSPLLGKTPENISWVIICISAIIGTILTITLYKKAHSRIPYWV